MTPFQVRPASDRDASAVAALLDRCTTEYFGRTTSIEDARSRLQLGDAAIAFAENEAAGFGHIWPDGDNELKLFIRVRPDYQGQGISTRLLAELLEKATPLKATQVTGTTWAADLEGQRFMKAAGFEPVRHFHLMSIDLTQWEPPALSGAQELRPYREPDDDAAIFDAFRLSFADHWGDANPDPTAWWRENRDDPSSGYDPSLWSVAERDGRIVGFTIAREHSEGETRVGWISLIGVVPDARGIGLGEALLRGALTAIRDRGLPRASLNVDVDNRSGALRLYEKVGMTSSPAFTVWKRDL